MSERILFLPHRIPFPPDKGDKVRSYHILRHLAAHAEVYLASFVDDPADWAHAGRVAELCQDSCLVPLTGWRARLRALPALATGLPLTVPYYADRRLRAWVDHTLAHRGIDRVLAFSSSMAQYAGRAAPGVRREIDFVDIDSEKWAQYAERARGPMRHVYRREARTLARYECRIASAFDASWFVSAEEAAAFRRLCPAAAVRVHALDNGVDIDYFHPQAGGVSPFTEEEIPIVFTGAMDYWPNVDAVTWFAEAVMPALRAARPGLRFYVVGRRPTPAVEALAAQPGVIVTGGVPDVRPYLRHAAVAVAPIRVARGVQNKVLEAMAMARPVVCSPNAAEGIRADDGVELLVAATPEDYVARIGECLAGERSGIGAAARRRVEAEYAWAASLAPLTGSTASSSVTNNGAAGATAGGAA